MPFVRKRKVILNSKDLHAQWHTFRAKKISSQELFVISLMNYFQLITCKRRAILIIIHVITVGRCLYRFFFVTYKFMTH